MEYNYEIKNLNNSPAAATSNEKSQKISAN